MDFGWLKRMMPRGLYGRAALILLVPIVTLQIVVSGQILQRYFQGVAGRCRMPWRSTRVSRPRSGRAGARTKVATALEVAISDPPAGEPQDRRRFYDLTGIEAIRILRSEVPGLVAVDLVTDWRRPMVLVDTEARARGPVGPATAHVGLQSPPVAGADGVLRPVS